MTNKLVKVIKSIKKGKKWTAIFKINNKEKKVNFGFHNLNDLKNDYTLHKDKERRTRYRQRHLKDLLTEKNKKGLGAGALSFYLLWGSSTSLKENIKSYKKRFNL
tara:strand:- start:454 stop:768 length:315 start_codon:yes stop_codon:yes gene_type:complete